MKRCAFHFFGEQLTPQLFGFFLTGYFLCVIFETKIITVVGLVFFFHELVLRLYALVGLCVVEENAVHMTNGTLLKR